MTDLNELSEKLSAIRKEIEKEVVNFTSSKNGDE